MQLFAILQLISLSLNLIKLAQSVFGKDVGKEKKAFVVDGILQNMKAGGQEINDETLGQVKDLIDNQVKILYPKEIEK